MNSIVKLVLKTILYITPVLLICFYIEFRLSRLDNSYSFKITNFEKVKSKCDVLILGNSQMLKGVNPDYISDNAFNMAHVSQTLTLDKAILEQYLPQMPRLKVIVLGVGYTSFGEDLEEGEEAWRLSFYKKHYKIPHALSFVISDYSNIFRYQPYESLKFCLKNFDVDLIKGFNANGYLKMEGVNADKLSDNWAIKRAEAHTKSLTKYACIRNKQALMDIIQLAAHRNIKVLLVAPPVMDNYQNKLNAQWLKINESILNEIFKQSGLKSKTFNNSGFKNQFNDVDHLNTHGARLLSIELAKRVKTSLATPYF